MQTQWVPEARQLARLGEKREPSRAARTRLAWLEWHRARGGSGHGNNLYAACIACNRSKQAVTSRTARAREGFKRAPLSQRGRDARRAANTTAGAIVGGIAGALALGPVGIFLGGAAGGILGNSRDPDA